ncbi:hypothetical protein Purlil1_4516 [Purpureocillium lilacinum]|uniref:Major facilitator superfamily (MFS) profile domain-containing protein n=1 Tax=Purpureocillium lilacinum TaxID=33203 RepID=A0ABR0C4B9_PURLI|nr:hypothetical protein Purlil1_4516 [Purpureocillium lilacinum]
MGPFTREPSVPQEVMEKIEKHSMEKTSQVQDNAVGVGEDIVISSSPTMAGVFSKKALIFGWASLLAVALMNYLDLVAVNTFQVYAMSEFNRLSIEGALTTAIGVATIVIQAPLAVTISHVSYFSVFAVATVVTTLGSVLQAAAPGLGVFLLGFVLNMMGGMGTRMIMFNTATSEQFLLSFGDLVLLTSTGLSTPKYRGTAFGAVNVPSVASSLELCWQAGAQVAESALKNIGWRWGYGIWAVMIPVVSPCLMAILFLFKRKSKHCSATVGSQKRQLWTHLREQDLFGILLLTAGIALFLLPIPLEQGGISQYASARLITPTALGFLLLLLLVVWEFKFARNPVIPRRVLSQRTIASVMASNAFQYAGINAAAAYFYPFLMVCSDLSISNATYITLIVGVVCQLMGLVYGFIMARYKQMKWIYVSGLAIALLGRGLQYEFVDPRTQMAGLVVSQLVAGIGFGVGIQGLTIAQGSANPKDYPIIIAIFFISSNVGASVAGAIVGAVWTTVLTAKLHANLPVELKSQAQAILNSLPVAQSFPLGSPERNSIIAAYISAYRILVLICLVATAIAFLISLFVEDVRMPENENGELPTGAYKNEGEKADAS